MVSSEQVVVIRPVETGRDSLNAPTVRWEDEPHVSVVVAPGATSDLDASRPEGVTVSMTLHFPKPYSKSLRGCKVRVRGVEYSVVGDPQPYTDQSTPGIYNRPVEVGVIDG